MDATVAIDGKAEALVEAALQGRLTETQAEQLAKRLAGSEPALVSRGAPRRFSRTFGD